MSQFKEPNGITIDGTNLYVSDTGNHKIRKIIIATGEVTTLAGSTTFGSSDGTGTSAKFYFPYGIVSDGTNLYVADTSNHKIRKIVIATGEVTTLAGSTTSGSIDGTGTSARFNKPIELMKVGTDLYVVDKENSEIRKIVIASGAVTTFAGSDTPYRTDATGTFASFNLPSGITINGANLYVADTLNHTIRKIVIATGEVTTFAGSTSGDIDGTGTAARFDEPGGITTDGTNLYVADTLNDKIRKIVIATGVVSTLAGSSSYGSIDGIGTAASFFRPKGITTDGTNLYVADSANHKIRKIVIATGVVTTLAGSGLVDQTDGIGTAARFYYPSGITIDGSNLYVADSDNHKIRKIVIATALVSTFAGTGFDGNVDGTGTAASFNSPFGIMSDGKNLYVADSTNHNIRIIALSSGVVSTLTGTGSAGYTDGIVASAKFNCPSGIISDGTFLYVADSENDVIRQIEF